MKDAPPQLSGHATMSDVASRAGVSLKSVSRVVNREAHVSDKLRAKVEAAIRELNYVPDTAARSLAGARSFTIGVLLDNPSPNYTMKVVAGAYRACTEQLHHLRIDNLDTTASEASQRRQIEQILRRGRCDGFVLTPPLVDNPLVLAVLDQSAMPYARLAPIRDPGRSDAVMIDDVAAGAAVADMFVARGHRRFGLVTGPETHSAALARRQGFVERVHQCLPDAVISEAPGGFSFEGGIAAGRELLEARRHPTAIFATNDDSAAGVMVACNQLGLTVPDDVSLCGFDDSWVAKSVWPYLTTIYQPIEEMAYAATMMLLEQKPDGAGTQLRELAYRLVERDSVATRG